MQILTPYQISETDILGNAVSKPPVYSGSATYDPFVSIVRQTGYTWVKSNGTTVIESFGGGLFFGPAAYAHEAQKEFLFIGEDAGNHEPPMLPPFRRNRRGELISYTLNSTDWEDVGTANYFKAFDTSYGINQEYAANTYTYDVDGSISWSIKLPGPVTAIAILGAIGTNVRIAKYDVDFADGALTSLYEGTLDKLYPEYPNAYYNTLPLGVLREQDVFLLDESLSTGDDIFIRIWNANSGQPAQVSNIVLGYLHDFGAALADLRITDASRSNLDFAADSFTFVPRIPGQILDVDVKLPGSSDDTSEFRRLQRLMRDHINRACLYIPDPDQPHMSVYGLPKTGLEMSHKAGGHTYYSMMIETV